MEGVSVHTLLEAYRLACENELEEEFLKLLEEEIRKRGEEIPITEKENR
ncbi:sporulation histidine kinase inhibitor Sda [Thalassorhabdus alkalitolerans]|uniref:Sporulation histidine kinase inhibitor Sda n=1 Tax=Thalassorhabdus alkalitolerans TaxID=2282697 RepID=A0ABW0YPK9_9BACI|nr:sporulation histidine kinase inhibitor Sda [Thalassobacillus sp. C254]